MDMSVPTTLRAKEPRFVSRLELLFALEGSLFDDGVGGLRAGEIESVSSSNDDGEGDRGGKEG